METYYALLMCGGISFCLAFVSLVQGHDLQAIFLLVFVVLSAILAIFFQLVEIKRQLERNNKDKFS